MQFHQKRMATHAWFDFDATELNYRVRDNSGDVEFSVDYAALPSNKRTVFQRNTWLRNVGLIWCVIGVIQIGLGLAGAAPLAGSAFWLLIGLGCLAFYRLTWSEFTIFDTSEGGVVVIKDKQHDAILDMLDDKRKSHLLSWYRSQNFENDPGREIETVEWLVKQHVLSKQEGKLRIAEIRGAQTMLLSSSDYDEGDSKIH